MGITVGTTTSRRLPVVVALACAFTYFGLETIPAPGTPTEMWATHAAAFVWTSLAWDGRSRPRPALVAHLGAQLLVFLGMALTLGWSPADAWWMGLTNVAGGVLMLVLYARLREGPDWAPTNVRDHVLLLGLAVLVSGLLALAGGFPNAGLGELDRLTLWWTVRGTVFAYVTAVTFLLLWHGPDGVVDPAPRWAVALLVPLGAACVWLCYLDPTLPLTWFLLVPALVGGSILSPRGAATYALVIALMSALATLNPVNQFGYGGFLPSSVIIDLLVTCATFVTIHLALVRLQRSLAAAELQRQRATAEEQALLLGTVFESMNDGLVVLDPDQVIVLHNAAARQLVGRRLPVGERVDWVSHLGLAHLDGTPVAPEELPGRERADYRRQFRVRHDGVDRVLDLGAWPMAGSQDRTVLLFSDVTAQHQRMRELTRFAGVVAHDLRSPLTTLHGWLELAEDRLAAGDTTRALENLARASLSSVRMRQVIEDWLAYAVQRDGVLTPTEVPLRGVAEEIVASYGQTEGTAPGIDLAVEHTVNADRVLTTQLLANLIGNAVKYAAPGEPARVTVRSVADGEPGFVRVEVSDRGIGLPAGEEERVFEEFHRADAHAEDYSGTGLGLSLCRRIVQRHGGSIWARNNTDGGATFSFTLPAA